MEMTFTLGRFLGYLLLAGGAGLLAGFFICAILGQSREADDTRWKLGLDDLDRREGRR